MPVYIFKYIFNIQSDLVRYTATEHFLASIVLKMDNWTMYFFLMPAVESLERRKVIIINHFPYKKNIYNVGNKGHSFSVFCYVLWGQKFLSCSKARSFFFISKHVKNLTILRPNENFESNNDKKFGGKVSNVTREATFIR